LRPPRSNPTLAESFDGLRADYSAAKQSRYRRRRTGISPSGSGADYHYRNECDYLRVMEYARDMDLNDVIVGQIIDRAVANEIQDGFTLCPLTGDPAVDKDLALRWYDYATDPEQCDLAAENSWWDFEQLVSRHVKVDGDVLGLASSNGSIELVEAHRLRTPQNTRQNVVHGVLKDPLTRKPLQYWLTSENIDPSAPVKLVGDMRRIAARDEEGFRQVFHVLSRKRVSQTRGISALAPIFDLCGMFEDINFATLVQRQLVACFAIFREREKDFTAMLQGQLQPGQGQTQESLPDGTVRIIEGMGPGREFVGWPGEKFKLDSPHVPNAEFFPHMKMILTLIGINLGLPLCLTLMDAGETNFSGFRGAVDQARMGFRQNQRRNVQQWHRPNYRRKVRGWLAEDTALQNASRRSGIAVYDHRWDPPTWPYIQPLQDASADLVRTRNALISQRRRCAERGMEWGDLSTEIVEDNGALIEKAFQKADELNKKYPGLAVTWREIASLPTADGINLSLSPMQTEQPNAAQ
jgi:capsid protein